MAQRRIRLNMSGGSARAGVGGIGTGAMKGMRVRRGKKSLKATQTQAEANAPELEETQSHVHGKQDLSGSQTMPRAVADTKAGSVVRVGLRRLKKIKPGGGVGYS